MEGVILPRELGIFIGVAVFTPIETAVERPDVPALHTVAALPEALMLQITEAQPVGPPQNIQRDTAGGQDAVGRIIRLRPAK